MFGKTGGKEGRGGWGGLLQACCRPSKNLTIGVKWTGAREKPEIFFSTVHYFLCLKLQPKQNLFLKGHWENFKIGSVPKQIKMNFMNKQTFFYVMSWRK